MSQQTLQLSGKENVWWFPNEKGGEIEFYGHGFTNDKYDNYCVYYPASHALKLLEFLKSIEEELIEAAEKEDG
jgi:hypothetical protein